MSIIIDLVIIAIIALCVLVGYHKGLTGSLLKIVSFVLALIIAFILFKPVSNFIIDKTDWDENLEQAIRQSILKDEEKTNDETQKENMPEVITDYINNAVEKAGNEAKTAIVDSTAREVAIMIINIAVAIALFIVSKIILLLLLVKGLANLLTKLPVIKQCDKLGGIIFGILQSLVIIYVALAIISFASPMMSETGIIEGLQKSYIGSTMYNNNLLLKIIF